MIRAGTKSVFLGTEYDTDRCVLQFSSVQCASTRTLGGNSTCGELNGFPLRCVQVEDKRVCQCRANETALCETSAAPTVDGVPQFGDCSGGSPCADSYGYTPTKTDERVCAEKLHCVKQTNTTTLAPDEVCHTCRSCLAQNAAAKSLLSDARTFDCTRICPTNLVPVTGTPATTSPPAKTTARPSIAPSGTPENASSPTVSPTPAATEPARGMTATTIAIVIVGSVVAVVFVVLLVVRCKRRHGKQAQRSDHHVATSQGDHTGAFVALTDDSTVDETPQRQQIVFLEGDALAPCRIPYHSIAFGHVISQGGYGEILRAGYNGQMVAIKRLLASRRSDPQSIRSFAHEIQLTAMLQHECIVQFIGAAWEEPSSLCLVSEFMVGGDLRALLVEYEKNGHANGHDDTKLRIAIHVAHAMTYLHSLDPPVVHRDLKSKNVLLTASLDAKLIDFGVSREQQDETMTAGIGTSLWMAPEVMLGKRYDGKADVFSFGVILSELDTHELPYDHARDSGSNQRMTSMVLLKLISKGRLLPHFTDAAHPAIVKLARDCLQLDPTLRPTATEVVNRIDACLQHDWALTEQTRTALDRAIVTVETQATTRATPPTGFVSVQIMLDTKASTRAPSS